jgi:hypothetical protein
VRAPTTGTFTTGGASSGPGFAPLPGQYAIIPTHLDTYLTAVNGGGETTGAIKLGGGIEPSQKFTLWADPGGSPYYAVQTENGDFLTAVNGGGLTTNALQTSATGIVDEGLFAVIPQSGTHQSPHYAFKLTRGFYLTAVGNSADPIHTDATRVGDWELFDLNKCGDPGTGSTYSFEAAGHNGFLTAAGGGRSAAQNALYPDFIDLDYTVAFTLIRQDDGTYALKTSSGYYVTANAGGLAGAGYRTDTPQVGDWEKFTLIANDSDCTSYIRTPRGTFLSIVAADDPTQPHNIIDNAADISHATRWRMWVMAF